MKYTPEYSGGGSNWQSHVVQFKFKRLPVDKSSVISPAIDGALHLRSGVNDNGFFQLVASVGRLTAGEPDAWIYASAVIDAEPKSQTPELSLITSVLRRASEASSPRFELHETLLEF
jgi:hypothetical protein